MIEAILLAALLHRPLPLVEAVYAAGGVDCVAIVNCENPEWDVKAIRREPRGYTSYGLGQIDNEWHNQHRGDVKAHIAEMARIYGECEGKDMATRVSHYNGGTYPPRYSVLWGIKVQRERDRMVRWLEWRRLKALGVAW